MQTTWILVSNSELAQIFLLQDSELVLIYELEHKESKEKVSQLVSDHAGRGQSKGWNQQYSLNNGQEVKDHEREKFALEMFHFLKKCFDQHQFKNLIIFSSPKLLGDIRHIFKPLFAHCPSREIDKEIPSFWALNEKVKYIKSFINP